jgi:predicted metal-binding protein
MNDQFNSNTKKRCPPLHLTCHEVYEMVKEVHVILGKWKRTSKNTEDDMWNKLSIFLELPYWKDLDVRHLIDVMHVEKNVCESLLETFF